MTWPPPPLVGMALVAVLLTVAVAAAAALRRLGAISGEVARKSVHVQLGLIIAAFPWLFTALWPAWCLTAVSVVALAGVRWWPWLRLLVGGSLHDVTRMSWGEFCFPIAAAVAWTLAPGDWIRFSLPILVLAVSDAVAALVGTTYGKMRYSAGNGQKSWEGSLAFFTATFLVVHVPLLLFTGVGRAESLLIATDMALLLMLVEALAWDGFDNLFIPVAGLLMINDSIARSVAELGERTLVLAALIIGSWWWRKRTTLDDAAVLACAVLGFELWAVCGWHWLVAPAILFTVYTAVFPPRATVAPEETRPRHRAIVPMTIMLPGFAWALVQTRHPADPRWLLAAAGTYTVHLAAIGLLMHTHRHPRRGWLALALWCWMVATLALVLPIALIIGPPAIVPALLACAGALPAVLALWWALPDRRAMPTHERRWALECLAALAGSSAVLLAPAA